MNEFEKEVKGLKKFGVYFFVSLICYLVFKNIHEYVESLLRMVVLCFGFYFFIFFIVVAVQYLGMLFGKILGSSKRKMSQLDKTDFKLEKEYYREILENSSPLIIGYIDNFKLSKNKIIAELLYLKRKNLIIFDDDKIIKADNCENVQLLKSEKMIIDSIYQNKFRVSDYDTFLEELKENVINEAENLLLVKEKKTKNKSKKINIDWKIIIDRYLRFDYIFTNYFSFVDYVVISFYNQIFGNDSGNVDVVNFVFGWNLGN